MFECLFLVFALINHCNLMFFLCSKLALSPCCAPLVFVACIISLFFCWCFSTCPCCDLLMFFGAFSLYYVAFYRQLKLLWSIGACWCIFVLLCWCSSTLFGCVLLVFVNTSWLCFVGVCLHLLIVLY